MSSGRCSVAEAPGHLHGRLLSQAVPRILRVGPWDPYLHLPPAAQASTCIKPDVLTLTAKGPTLPSPKLQSNEFPGPPKVYASSWPHKQQAGGSLRPKSSRGLESSFLALAHWDPLCPLWRRMTENVMWVPRDLSCPWTGLSHGLGTVWLPG